MIGRGFDLGLKRCAPEILSGDLRQQILPLRQGAPIYLEPPVRPEFDANESLVKLPSVEMISR